MTDQKPYISYKFSGAVPITDSFSEAGITFRYIDDGDVDRIYDDNPGLFKKENDSIRKGEMSRGDEVMYFLEFGIRLHSNLMSYITFVYNSSPTIEEMRTTANDIEPIIMGHLEQVKNQQQN